MHVGQLHLPHENKAPHIEEEAGVRLASGNTVQPRCIVKHLLLSSTYQTINIDSKEDSRD